MSRYAKIPIFIPEGIEIQLGDNKVQVKGIKGELSFATPLPVKVVEKEGSIWVNLKKESDNKNKSFIGLTFKMITNMIIGVTKGFEKNLEFSGVGYKMVIKENVLNMQLGFSHDINYEVPTGVNVLVKQNTLTVSGIDKELVGRVADKIKSFKAIEPYKAKGIKYSGQYVLRKVGKSGKSSG